MAKAVAQQEKPFSPFLTLLEQLGEGSFGKVFKALHHARTILCTRARRGHTGGARD